MEFPENESKIPEHHTANVKTKLEQLITHLREDIDKVEDAKAQALFETSAEVLTGLKTAFEHYEKRSEDVWK